MKQFKISLVALSIFALLLLSMSTASSQNTISKFSRLTTSGPTAQTQWKPKAKFNRVPNSFPNRYIVVLNDDVVSPGASLNVRRSQVKAVAENLAQLHGGRLGFIYDTALKGFSIELPSEAAAIALSQHPRVDWVEEEGRLYPTAVQSSPPWGLDRIDQTSLPLNAQYVFNATGTGVRAYIIDSGIRTTHVEFQGRAFIRADYISGIQSDLCTATATNNDCFGHGTHVAGTVGGSTFGVAKSVTIRSVKVCSGTLFVGCPTSAIIAGVDLTTSDHAAEPSIPVVANMSLGGFPNPSIETAVQNSINAGVTYVVAAGNDNVDAVNFTPARMAATLTVGASAIDDSKASFSNFGTVVDLFAPGKDIISAWRDTDTQTLTISGTSMASPHVAGAVALYLQGRTGMTNCSANPKQGPSTTSGTAISTCPDRIHQFIVSNATVNQLTGLPSGTANRLLYTGSLPTTTNPIENNPFFVWQQYVDFLNREPDSVGFANWTGNLNACGTDWPCLNAQRIHNMRGMIESFEFKQNKPALLNPTSTDQYNREYVRQLYLCLLRREPDSGGLETYVSELNATGDYDHTVFGFVNGSEYRTRFGQH
jgi:subtilisin family serine protease